MKRRSLRVAMERCGDGDADRARTMKGLADWAAGAADEELWRINAFSVADEIAGDREALLEGLIVLAVDGFVELNWDFHCTECNAVAGTHHHLRDATATSHCPLCDVQFRNDLTRNVEVTFTPSPQYYEPPRRFLARQAKRTAELHRQGAIRLPDPRVTGMDCLHSRLFRELFAEETLSLRESMRIGHVCLMFTDIKGSTALYERLGDSSAYGLVRRHFEILFDLVNRAGGVVVKTIGDSVMASFKQPADGVRAAREVQRAFRRLNTKRALKNEILVRIGLHAGSTIMVNLNDRIDYFGQTVNLAARLQGHAEGGEIVISEAMRRDPDTIAALRHGFGSLTRRSVSLKGIRGNQTVYRLNDFRRPTSVATTRLAAVPST